MVAVARMTRGRGGMRLVASVAATAMCALGLAAPAQGLSRSEPVPVPTDPVSAGPVSGMLPNYDLTIDIDVTYAWSPQSGFGGRGHEFVLRVKLFDAAETRKLSRSDCQEVVNAFWTGSGEGYRPEVDDQYGSCTLQAFYSGEAAHGLYALDAEGNLRIRVPVDIANNMAGSFKKAHIRYVNVIVPFHVAPQCKGNTDLRRSGLTGSPDTLCDWKLVDDKATHVSGDPLMVLKIDQSLADEAQLTVGPFTNLTLPAQVVPASADGAESSTGSRRTVLIAIGSAALVFGAVAAGGLWVGLRRMRASKRP
nr:hypothetical protein [uncultured Actinomyces sp.]